MNTSRLTPCTQALAALILVLLLSLLGSSHAQAQEENSPPLMPAGRLAAAGLLTDIQAISGGDHTCAVTTGGGVLCWGNNNFGQLGDGTTTDRLSPVDVSGLTSGVQAISAGGLHTCALTTGGGVKCWGSNGSGRLGDDTTTDRHTPVDVVGLTSGVQAITAGSSHTCALTTDGGVKCWGDNFYGKLGDGTRTDSHTPVNVSGLSSGVQALAAGRDFTCALTTAGGVKCWGRNIVGQLGDGSRMDFYTPVDVSGLNSGVQAITAGYYHTCAVTTAGGIKCWGNNDYGQLGDGTRLDRYTPVDVSGPAAGAQAVGAGHEFTCALIANGGVKCWGWNERGQLGEGTIVTFRLTPVDVNGLASDVQAITVGYRHTCALTTTGNVKCWGGNERGQLGNGTTISRYTAVDVSGLSSGVQAITAGCVLTTGGVKCWGDNSFGQLGDGTYNTRYMPLDVIGLSSGVQAVDAGGHTCALTVAGGVKCWGNNSFGQTGDGTQNTYPRRPVNVSGLTNGVQAISTGSDHTCAVTTAGGIKCWGRNDEGQLGDGTTENRLTPVDVSGLTSGVQMVSAGYIHTCALTTDGGVKCWGRNIVGQLGDGTYTDHLTPVDVTGLAGGVQMVSASGSHTCALTTAGGIKCWGDNSWGQLGDGTTFERPQPVDVTGLTSGVQMVASGGSYTCALTTAGGVKCWGRNDEGQLGDGTTTGRPTPVDVNGLASSMQAVAPDGRHTCALSMAGGVKCWGNNSRGQLGVNPGWSPVDVIAPYSIPDMAAQITSAPATAATVGQPYTYSVTATGVPTPTFSLVTAPAGMTIDPTSGLIQWTPAAAGDQPVTVRAENGVQPPAEQSFTITVSPAPQAAQITSTPVTAATVSQPYTYAVTASGVPTPTFRLVTAPAGMTIDPTSGLIQWTPAAAGDHPVTVRAENGAQPPTEQSFTITVANQQIEEGEKLYLPLVNR